MNLQKNLDALLSDIERTTPAPSLLLHACCAPCSSYVLEYLSRYFTITLFWYNPNIFPESEHSLRFNALLHLPKQMNLANPAEIIRETYEPDFFRGATRGLESEPEGGKRCEICFRLRLERTAKLAAHCGAQYFATTLSVGPRKNAALLHEISLELSDKYGIGALPCDFKKRGGYARSVELARELGLYRQSYCGCAYSK